MIKAMVDKPPKQKPINHYSHPDWALLTPSSTPWPRVHRAIALTTEGVAAPSTGLASFVPVPAPPIGLVGLLGRF